MYTSILLSVWIKYIKKLNCFIFLYYIYKHLQASRLVKDYNNITKKIDVWHVMIKQNNNLSHTLCLDLSK